MAYDPKPSPSAYDLQMGQGFRGRGSGKSHGKFTVLGYGSFCGSLQEGSHFGEYKERRPLIRLSYLSRDVDSWRFEVRTCKPYLHSCLVPGSFHDPRVPFSTPRGNLQTCGITIVVPL